MTKIPPWIKALTRRIVNPTINPLEFFEYIAKDNDFLRLPVFKPSYLVNDPDTVYHIMLTNQHNYTKAGTTYERVENVVGTGLLTTSGEDWLQRRQMFQPYFHGRHLQETIAITYKHLEKKITEWRQHSGNTNISAEMLSLLMNISSEALLGVDVSSRSLEIVRMIHLMNTYAIRSIFLWKWLPTIRNVRYQLAKKVVDNFILDAINQKNMSNFEPLLCPLFSDNENDQTALTQEYILGEVKNFFIAGHETTGNALSWCLYLLAKNPYVLRVIQKEIKTLGTTTRDYDKINTLPYLEMVINETLRLYPPIWIFTRKALDDDQFVDYRIPKHATVQILPYLLHRHPKYWNQPDVFYPERFQEKVKHKCIYIPFGFGPRTCIGRQFAMMNMKLILVEILSQFEVELIRNHYDVAALPLITLKPEKDIKLKLTWRS